MFKPKRLVTASLLIIALLLGTGVSNSSGTKYVGTEHDVKAAFVYHFTKFVQWHDTKQKREDDQELKIGVIADDDMLSALMALDGKKSQKKIIRIIPIKNLSKKELPDDISILFIQKGFGQDDGFIIPWAIERHILTISDEPDAVKKGIIIELYKSGRKIRFDINFKVAQKSQIELSSRLLSLARRVLK